MFSTKDVRLLSDHPVHGYHVNIVVLEESKYLRLLLFLREPLATFPLMDFCDRQSGNADTMNPALRGSKNVFSDSLAVYTIGYLTLQPGDEH